MSINIYGNLTVTGNCSFTTTRSRSRRDTAAAENPLVETPPPQQDRSTPVAQTPTNNPATPRRRSPRLQSPSTNPGTTRRRFSRNNLVPPRRRSSRIARIANFRYQPMYLQRRPLPSVYEDHDFWMKIRTLPANLLPYLSPEWLPYWTTRDLLRQIIWHFAPNQRIPCRLRKAEIVELFDYHVVNQYGAYFGI